MLRLTTSKLATYTQATGRTLSQRATS